LSLYPTFKLWSGHPPGQSKANKLRRPDITFTSAALIVVLHNVPYSNLSLGYVVCFVVVIILPRTAVVNPKAKPLRSLSHFIDPSWATSYDLLIVEYLSLSRRVFENRLLRTIVGPKRDEATGEWRRRHNVELNDLYSSPNIIRVIKSRRMKWAGHVARMGEKRGAYGILVGRPEGRRPLGRPRRRWEGNIRMDLQ
jgi:hypothetical protein